MHVLVRGASGFVGRALAARLLGDSAALPRPLRRLTAIDQRFPAASDPVADPRLHRIEGNLADPALLAQAVTPPPDLVFHLASVPGSQAEREPELGWQANLVAPLALLRQLAGLGRSAAPPPGTDPGAAPPRVVFASSVAVYGAKSAQHAVDEAMPERPSSSYGAHKLTTEILLADLSRTGRLDGISLRLPGIVARSVSSGGHGSAFMSDIIRRLLAGDAYDCPVSPAAQAWWMSLPCCIDNLLHAAVLPADRLDARRCVQLPVLTATVAELVAAIEAQRGSAASVRWLPDARIESVFGRMPQLATPKARALGFRDDVSLAQLLRNAVVAGAAPGK